MIGWLLALALGTYLIWLFERRITTGSWYWLTAVSTAYGGRGWPEKPTRRDKVFYDGAPLVFALAVVTTATVLPLSPGASIVPLATGALFINAALAYVMVAAVMAGWAPNREFPMVGAWRFLGQFIAYGMPIVMAIAAVAMRAESLNIDEIVASQTGVWNAVFQPLGFLLFFFSAVALAFLPPFDGPVATSEIKGGVFASYNGWRYLVMRTAHMALILVLAWAIAIFYLGGWHGPVLVDWLWTAVKTVAVAVAMLSLGGLVPRFSVDKVLAIGWKLAIPLALLNIFVVGLLLLGGMR